MQLNVKILITGIPVLIKEYYLAIKLPELDILLLLTAPVRQP